MRSAVYRPTQSLQVLSATTHNPRYQHAPYTMDVLVSLPTYRVLICTPCGKAIIPRHLFAHLRRLHMSHSYALGSVELIHRSVKDTLPSIIEAPLVDPNKENVTFPPPDSEPLPGLQLHQAFGCNHCPFACGPLEVMMQHYNQNHALNRRTRGGLKSRPNGPLRERLDREHYGD